MIIATGSVDINEATRLAQNASDSASDLADKIKNLKASLDGTIIESPNTPFDDGKEHNDGDMWLVMSGNVATSMYIYSGGSWTLKKWDVTSLAVEYLSALSANLGNVQAGNINGVNIFGSSITGGTITENSANGTITLDSNGFSAVSGSDYFKFTAGGNSGYCEIVGGLEVDAINVGSSFIGGQRFQATGNLNTHVGSANAWTYLAEGIKCSPASEISPVSGTDIYFHNQAGSTIDIHAGDVISHGNKLKSALSSKRDVTDYSTDEALSAVMNTDVKKWKYKDADNSADSQHIGPIIDDVNEVGKKATSIANDMIGTDKNGNYFLNESNTISILLAALKKSNQRIDELSYRITQLERKNA